MASKTADTTHAETETPPCGVWIAMAERKCGLRHPEAEHDDVKAIRALINGAEKAPRQSASHDAPPRHKKKSRSQRKPQYSALQQRMEERVARILAARARKNASAGKKKK